jgi:hypothetical protein
MDARRITLTKVRNDQTDLVPPTGERCGKLRMLDLFPADTFVLVLDKSSSLSATPHFNVTNRATPRSVVFRQWIQINTGRLDAPDAAVQT